MDHVLLLTPQLTPGVFTQEARTAQPGCVRSGAFLKRAGKDLGVPETCAESSCWAPRCAFRGPARGFPKASRGEGRPVSCSQAWRPCLRALSRAGPRRCRSAVQASASVLWRRGLSSPRLSLSVSCVWLRVLMLTARKGKYVDTCKSPAFLFA